MTEPHEPDWVHRYPVRVQFEDVDQYGIVHHPRYLLFMERARVDLMGVLGMRGEQLGGEHLGLIVAQADIKFLASARFLDDLEVHQGCAQAGASRIVLEYLLRRGADRICAARLTLAFVDGTGRPVRAPTHLRDGLRAMGTPQ